MNKNEISFIDLVIDMRNAQKEYFKTRSRSALDKSKHLVKLVDGYIMDKYLSGQLEFQTEVLS